MADLVPEPLSVPPDEPRPPAIPGYEIEGRIGAGATGVVYRARQKAVDREVALKILHPELSQRTRIVLRLQREARTSARLAHPHVVSAIDMGEADGRWWYAMELVEGPSLSLRIRQEGRLSEREALRLFIPLCEALEHLWEHGVVHRDIKPANILIDKTRGAQLADLGLAFADDDPELTGQGGTLGTPAYISPEQAVDPRQADVRSDIWSFGATMFHAICGRAPFAGDSTAEVLSAVLYARIPDPLELQPDLSKGLAWVLRKCLARNPDGRYPNPHELRLELERIRERRQPKVRRSELDPVHHQTALGRWAIGGALVLVALGAALYPLFQERGEGVTPETTAAGPAGTYEPLEELLQRARRRPELLGQLLLEGEELSTDLPQGFSERHADVQRELKNLLRREVRSVQDEVEGAVDEALEQSDYDRAWNLIERGLDDRFRSRTGLGVAELERHVRNEPWRARVREELAGQLDVLQRELTEALELWSRRQKVRADDFVMRQEWNEALQTLAVQEDAMLAAVGYDTVRLPAARLEPLLQQPAIELRVHRQSIEDAWARQDRDLRQWVERRASTLRNELEQEAQPFGAADELRQGFEQELFVLGLERSSMPDGLPHQAEGVLEDRARELLEFEDRLLARRLQVEFESSEALVKSRAAARAYDQCVGIWIETAAMLVDGRGIQDAPWRIDLQKRADERRLEAEILAGVLTRAEEVLRGLDGQEVELTLGGIRYRGRLAVGRDPIQDGFRLEALPERLRLQSIPRALLESWGGLAEPHTPEERLTLSLLRYYEGDSQAARKTLRSGSLPTEGPLASIARDLALRILDRIEDSEEVARDRRDYVQSALEFIFDPGHHARRRALVLAKTEELLSEYGEVPLVRERRLQLLAVRDKLSQPALETEVDLERQYGPTEIRYPKHDRVVLRYRFEEASVGAWEARDWAFDGVAWSLPRGATRFEDLKSQSGPRLVLHKPLAFDQETFRVELTVSQVDVAAPAQLFLVSAGGFHVVLVGPGLPGSDRRARWHVATGDVREVIDQMQAGAGQRSGEPLLVPGEAQRLVLRANRRSGRCELSLDGRLLGTPQVAPPKRVTFFVTVRSWEPVRLLAAEIEAGWRPR